MRNTALLSLAGLVLLLSALGAPAAAQDAPLRTGRARVRYGHVDIAGLIPDTVPSMYLFQEEQGSLHHLLDRLERARQDKGLSGLIITVRGFGAGWAKVQEIRRAITACRESGKEVVCVLEGAGNGGYYLASAADRVVMPPAAHLMLVGLRAEVLFGKDLLDKVGVKAETVQAGRYKSAPEALSRSEPSPEFTESLGAVLDDLHAQLAEGIAEGRGMPVQRAVDLIAGGPYTARQAREAGLVDDVLFYDEMVTQLQSEQRVRLLVQRRYGLSRAAADLPQSPMAVLSTLMGSGAPSAVPTGPTIAVIHAVGPIVSGTGGVALGEQVVAAQRLIKTVRNAAAAGNVKAIVLRIDSPGGSAQACDAVWRELRLADGKKPVIASLSDTAASGGYYLAAGARKIISEPGCLTGSIGVFGGKIVLTGLMEKLGINVVVFERGGNTGITSMFGELSPAERSKLEELIADTYRTFLARVAETRPDMSSDDVDNVAEGRIWTARQALALGLVDELGGLAQAVEAAREAAGIGPNERVGVVHLPRPRSLLEYALFGDDDAVRASASASGVLPLPEGLRAYVGALLALRGEVAVCMLPALVTIR